MKWLAAILTLGLLASRTAEPIAERMRDHVMDAPHRRYSDGLMTIDIAFFQTVAAACSALIAIATVVNRAKIGTWFKRREELVAERNVAFARVAEMVEHVREARVSVAAFERTVKALEINLNANEVRIRQLEERQPLYDACILWIPRAIEYIVWVETLAATHGIDLGGRQMPELPAIIREHFAGRYDIVDRK